MTDFNFNTVLIECVVTVRRCFALDSCCAFSHSWLLSYGPGVSGSSERHFCPILARSFRRLFANLL